MTSDDRTMLVIGGYETDWDGHDALPASQFPIPVDSPLDAGGNLVGMFALHLDDEWRCSAID